MQPGGHAGNAAAAPGWPVKKNPPATGWRLARGAWAALNVVGAGGARRLGLARTLARSRFGWWVRS